MRNRRVSPFSLLSIIAAIGIIFLACNAHAQDTARPWMNPALSPENRAELALEQLTLDEKLALLHGGGTAHNQSWEVLTNGGVGYVDGVERLGLPSLVITNASYGVYASGQSGRYSTAMPSNLALASSWDPQSACEYGAVIGSELRDEGFNMSLGGGVNLAREPRNGRTFEYEGEDPLLAGIIVGNLMKCEQGQHVLGDVKHYALNDQETRRGDVNVVISKRAMQESDLLAFHIAISIANPGAVMCSYNRINGDYACENSYTLNDVLKKEWGFKGFVISDWGGTESTEKASSAGLDQEQPQDSFFGGNLKEAVKAGRVPLSEVDDHVRRILYAEFSSGIVDDPPVKRVVDVEKGLEVARQVEEKSIVLLKNDKAVLPILPSKVHSVAIIGGHADRGMISGGGSAQVDSPGGDTVLQGHVWFATSPLNALQSVLPNMTIHFNPGSDPQSAVTLARNSDVAIVFVYQGESEGADLPSLSLPDDQDALIELVASANPRTIVVLETGTAITMPWVNKVAGVVEAWYAGSAGHKALANVLVGSVNPSGKLAITFPKSENDLPHPVILPRSVEDWKQGTLSARPDTRASLDEVHYDEGPEVGYKWFEAQHKEPLFAFGFGLSYTTFAYSGLNVDSTARTVMFTVTNTGNRGGTEVAEVYANLPDGSDEPYKRLAGWKRIELAPHESRAVTIAIDSRVLQTFDETSSHWKCAPGDYKVSVGGSSDRISLSGNLRVQ